MAYDFSRGQTQDIREIRDRVQSQINNNPTQAGVAELIAYVKAADEELNRRAMKNVLIWGAAGVAAFVILRKRR